MRRNSTGFILFLLVALFICSPAVRAETTLKIAYPSFVPFHYSDESDNLTGFFYEIMTEALENRLGIKLAWTPYPWARCQENVKNGLNDAIITVPTPERAVYTKTHSTPFYTKKMHLFTLADHPLLEEIKSIQAIADIKKQDFSVITYSGNGWHKRYVASLGIETVESSSITNIWHMLRLKRGDLVIEWPAAALPCIKQLELTKQVLDTNIVLSEMPFHLMIRKGSVHVNILDDFDRTIESMRSDGTLDSILNRYR